MLKSERVMKNITLRELQDLAKLYNKMLSEKTADFMISQIFKGVF